MSDSKASSSSVFETCFVSSGAMNSVLWEPMARTVKVCATALTALDASTSTEAVYVSQASEARTAERGCVHTANTACTASGHVSARTNIHSGKGRCPDFSQAEESTVRCERVLQPLNFVFIRKHVPKCEAYL